MISNLFSEIKKIVQDSSVEISSLQFNIEYKLDNSPVTQADKLLEQKIKTLLQNSLPDLFFIGEESFLGEALPEKGYVALLDPIDGTENFCSGLKEWGISLGLWKDGIHQGSLLMMPELNEYLLTGEIINYTPYSRITGFSSSYNDDIATGIKEAIEYRVTGCAVYNLINVIRGSFCRFVNPKGAYAWDLLPGLMLALEHNCEVILDDKPFNGQLLDPTRKYRVDIRHRYDFHSR